jgi:CBS domain-containing protein
VPDVEARGRLARVDDTAAFLARFPPFDHLARDVVESVAGASTLEPVEEGEDVLVEDGAPATALYVIRTGSMELLHENQVVDILEPGEMFGHPSLLTELSPAFTVRGHERGSVLVIARDAALRALGEESGTRFVARSLRERMVRTGRTLHALPELYATKVGSLVRGPPLFCPGSTPVGEAARRMTEAGVPALLVPTRAGVGVVSDADLRENVLAAGFDADVPVSVAARRQVLTVAADRLAGDAVIEMLDAGVHELAVTDPEGRIVGVVTADQVLDRERSPFTMRRALMCANDEAALDAAAATLPSAFLGLVKSGLAPPDVSRVLSVWSDAATARLIDFSIARHGEAPAGWAWLALGSVARRELTLASDQDNALAYEDPPSGRQEEVDRWFERFATEIDAGLARCGFGPDAAEVLASNRAWRKSRSAWATVLGECLEYPDRSHLVRAAVTFDFRHVAGGLDVDAPFSAVIRQAPAHPDFIARLARTATDARPPLGFRGTLKGQGRRTIDLKKGGVLPVTNLARFYAVAAGITVSATLDRITAVEARGALDSASARSLREAFGFIARLRLEHHAAQVESGAALDDLIAPGALPPLVRAELRETFRAVADAQKRLGVYAPTVGR